MSAANDIPPYIQDFNVYLRNCFLSRIVSGLAQHKKIDVTVDELVAWLQLPDIKNLNPPPISIGNINPPIPPFLRGTGVVVNNGKKLPQNSARGRRKLPTTNSVEVELPPCKYVFQRGTRRGQQCNEPSDPTGNGYCKNCLKKQSVKNDSTQKTLSPNLSVHIPAIPDGMMVSSCDDEINESDETISINVVPLPGAGPGMFIEESHKFVLQQLPNRNIFAIAVQISPDEERDLTDEEKRIAESMGFLIGNETNEYMAPIEPTQPEV